MQNISSDRSGFVSLTERIPSLLLDIRYYSTYNFIGDRIDGYNAPVALMTREAADALSAVAARLESQGYLLRVFDAYRPQRAVDHFVRWAEDTGDQRMKPYFYPDVDKARLFELDFISRRSAHSRGSTVDLTLFSMAEGRDLDMGSPFDLFSPLSHAERRAGLAEAQIANRLLLREAMLGGGFRPLASEWWHFTLNNEPYPETAFDFPVDM